MPHLRAIIFSNRFLSHPNHLIPTAPHTPNSAFFTISNY
nr:MAG TPA: hypothetical protein [Caudoviricetes sp.]